ncbi:MAG: hypothetical protein HC939_21080 [Pleurocapsa sp. SU_5_0]|nr:hypothetical protein [Pleurocapsa sp. SU_5_0]NJO98287.1 hypothetical protein [Pleurocapsa sp. CRU_1_2]NJR45323.1 hypothetical protein [Hyellaceae cyanobacterium CSU_1_1]
MATQEKTNQIKITLPLVALCLPLFVNYHVKAENSCPYETYIRVEQKCVDISTQRLNDITEEFESNAVKEVNQEIEGVSQKLEELSEELEEYCHKEQPETSIKVEIREDVCQY